MDYEEFIETKTQLKNIYGFNALFVPDYLFDFQKHIIDRSPRTQKRP